MAATAPAHVIIGTSGRAEMPARFSHRCGRIIFWWPTMGGPPQQGLGAFVEFLTAANIKHHQRCRMIVYPNSAMSYQSSLEPSLTSQQSRPFQEQKPHPVIVGPLQNHLSWTQLVSTSTTTQHPTSDWYANSEHRDTTNSLMIDFWKRVSGKIPPRSCPSLPPHPADGGCHLQNGLPGFPQSQHTTSYWLNNGSCLLARRFTSYDSIMSLSNPPLSNQSELVSNIGIIGYLQIDVSASLPCMTTIFKS